MKRAPKRKPKMCPKCGCYGPFHYIDCATLTLTGKGKPGRDGRKS